MLQQIHGYNSETSTIHTMTTVIELTLSLLDLMNSIVPTMFMDAAVLDKRWTLQEWGDWFRNSTFDRHRMNDAIVFWKDEIFRLYINIGTKGNMQNAQSH